MGSPMIHAIFAAALSASLSGAAPVSESLVVLASSSVSVHRGHTTILPCWLNPQQSAEGLEVRWYRGNDHFDSPIVLYKEKTFVVSQDASYVGRVSFGTKDAESGGLMAGDVSLMLLNATLEDAGDYTCYVSSDQNYDGASVRLFITETGSPPILSPVWKEYNMVNVSCESGGWHPEPILLWFNQKQVLTPKSLKYSKDSSGLLSVHSWLLVVSSSEVSCSVGLSGEEAKEARVRLDRLPQAESGSSAAGWVAFALLLIAVLAVLGVMYFKKQQKKTEESNKDEVDAREREKLLSNEVVILSTDITALKKHYANVTLDKTGNQFLKIKDHIVRDAGQVDLPDGQKVTCLTAIKGTPGFSSGQHYWEVSLARPGTGTKQSWWVGVTSVTDIPQKLDFCPTASNGFWFLSSSPDKTDHLQCSTEPPVLLPICSRPQTVGVYLNYDSGELSFYDVERNIPIGSFTGKFTSELFPFFNPGTGDKAPMEILHDRTEQCQSSDTRNSVDSTAQETKS